LIFKGKFESALKKYEAIAKIFQNEVPLAPAGRKNVLQLYVFFLILSKNKSLIYI